MWGDLKEVLLGLCVYCTLFAIPASLWWAESLPEILRKIRPLAPSRSSRLVLDIRRVKSWQH